jgi:glucokinase
MKGTGRLLLAGDIGGTKSAFALFDRETGPRVPLRRAEFPSQQFPSLEAVVAAFLERGPERITSACFGVAGPIIDGHAKATNLPWTFDERTLADALGVPSVALLNDVQATAQAIPSLLPDEVETIIEGSAVAGGVIALVAPGTGLGEAFLVWNGVRYRPEASEGGHTDFAPTDDEQAALLAHMQQRFEHVSYERVCSGIGIPNIYDFLRDTSRVRETPAIAERLSTVTDRTRIILDAALGELACPLCVRTLEMFVSILGAECGNRALKVLATGGLFLAGGIPRNILPALRDGRFQQAFRDKGRLSDVVTRLPVRVITGDAALLGAAIWGLQATEAGGPCTNAAAGR